VCYLITDGTEMVQMVRRQCK